ncbi:MAG TPA: peptidase C39 family protein, partial [Ramlibacter sp.]|uniref:peptidase C39 family protein n=1 Tax=Ramlibacter sp. TaxID=1917967 RepID=UPI002BAF014B
RAPARPPLRRAAPEDLAALCALEESAFSGDRISARSWRSLLASASAAVLVAPAGQQALDGAAVLLTRRASGVARLYSIAVASAARGHGVGGALVQACIEAARGKGCSVLRLETRADNRAAQSLFRRFGFTEIGRKPRYYADGQTAWRFEKSLWNPGGAGRPVALAAPFYAQTLDFTCGPCALMMAMAALRPQLPCDRASEIRLWREATTVFMAAGHGGCGPFGLALAAARRGFRVTVHAPAGTRLFTGSVRDERKKEVIELVEADSREHLQKRPDARIDSAPVTPERIASHLQHGAVPVVLISLWRLHGEKGPHWVVVTGFDGSVFRILDPMAEPPPGDPGIGVGIDEFRRITRYGRRRHTAAVVLESKKT